MTTRPTLPQNYTSVAGTLFEGFETPADWAVLSGTGTFEADAVNYRSGSGSLKISSGTTNGVQIRKIIAADLSAVQTVEFDIYFYTDPTTTLQLFTLGLGQEGGYYGKGYAYTIIPYDYNRCKLRIGWNHFVINRSDFALRPGGDWANQFIRIFCSLSPIPGQTVTASIDNITIGKQSIPQIVCMFDDMHASDFTVAYPIMEPLGIPGTSFCMTGSWGYSGCLTLAQADTLYAAGWDISSHTKEHTDLAGLSLAVQTEHIQTAQDMLLARYPRSAKYIAFPTGSTDANTLLAMKAAGVTAARGAVNWHVMTPLVGDAKYAIQAMAAKSSLTVPVMKTYIDYCKKYGSSLFLIFHEVGGEELVDITVSDFTEVMQYIASQKIPCRTFSEWYNGLTNPRYQSLPVGRT